MRDRRLHPAGRAASVVGICLAAAILLRIAALEQPLDRDSALYAAIGQRLSVHTLPYRDLFDHKQPLIHWIYGGLHVLAPGSLAGIRIAAAVPSALAAAGLFLVLERIAGTRRAALAAALTVVLSASTLLQGTDLNTEHLVVLPAAATVLGSLALGRSQRGTVPLVIGVLGGVAVLSKAIGGLIALAALIPLLAGREARGQTIAGTLVRFGAGLAVPIGLVVLGYAAAGAVDDLAFANLTYNSRYVGEEGFALAPKGPEGVRSLVVAATCCGVARLIPRRGRDIVGWTFLVWLLGTWIGAQLSSRGFPHYYVPVVVPAVVLLVLPAEGAGGSVRLAMTAARLVGAVAALAIALPIVQDMGRNGDEIAAHVYGRETLELGKPADVVAAVLDRRREPRDELYVVGAEPEYYWRSGMASYRRWLFDLPAEIAPERFLPEMAGLCRDGPRFVVVTVTPLPSYARRCTAANGYAEILRSGPITLLERPPAARRAPG